MSQWRNADAAAAAAASVSTSALAPAFPLAFFPSSALAPVSALASANVAASVANNWPFWPHRVVCCYRYCCQRASTPFSPANCPAICSHVLQSCPASPPDALSLCCASNFAFVWRENQLTRSMSFKKLCRSHTPRPAAVPPPSWLAVNTKPIYS